jgi:hypothetical protein
VGRGAWSVGRAGGLGVGRGARGGRWRGAFGEWAVGNSRGEGGAGEKAAGGSEWRVKRRVLGGRAAVAGKCQIEANSILR